MQVKFTINAEPFSVNRMYYRDKRHKTQAYQDWELSIVQALLAPDVQEKLAQIREAFKPDVHAFSVKFDYQFPANVLLNKQGQISSRAEDLSNIEKPLLDVLFLPKFHVQAKPWGCPNVNADDKHVLQLTSRKSISRTGNFQIRISIRLLKRAA